MKHLLISGYSKEDQPSMALYSLNDLDDPLWSQNITSPSYCAVNGNRLFTVTEKDGSGTFHYIQIDVGEAKLIHSLDSSYGALCHISYLPECDVLIASSYEHGVIVLLKEIDSKLCVIQEIVQEKNDMGLSRVHCAYATVDEQWVYTCNIATDRVHRYALKENSHRKLELIEDHVYQLPGGVGPRHLVIDEDNNRLYVNTEYSNELYELDMFSYNRAIVYKPISNILESAKKLSEKVGKGKISVDENHYSSSIVMISKGQLLLNAIRGCNMIVVYEVLEKGIRAVDLIELAGSWPRDVYYDEDEEQLYVANQYSHSISLYKHDELDGFTFLEDIEFDNPSFVKVIDLP